MEKHTFTAGISIKVKVGQAHTVAHVNDFLWMNFNGFNNFTIQVYFWFGLIWKTQFLQVWKLIRHFWSVRSKWKKVHSRNHQWHNNGSREQRKTLCTKTLHLKSQVSRFSIQWCNQFHPPWNHIAAEFHWRHHWTIYWGKRKINTCPDLFSWTSTVAVSIYNATCL